MKRLIVLLVIVSFISAANATLTTVATTSAKDATVFGSLGGAGLWGISSAKTYIGDDGNGSWHDNCAVAKFELPLMPAGEMISNVKFSGYFWADYGSYPATRYVKIKHFTYDNFSDVSAADYDNANLEDGQTIGFTADGLTEFDVTNFVQSDIANGNTYTSFVLQMVKADGSAYTSADNLFDWFYMVTVDGSWGEDSKPHLDITTIPEPATMALLIIGGLIIRRTK
jgi:hypothetical protein